MLETSFDNPVIDATCSIVCYDDVTISILSVNVVVLPTSSVRVDC